MSAVPVYVSNKRNAQLPRHSAGAYCLCYSVYPLSSGLPSFVVATLYEQREVLARALPSFDSHRNSSIFLHLTLQNSSLYAEDNPQEHLHFLSLYSYVDFIEDLPFVSDLRKIRDKHHHRFHEQLFCDNRPFYICLTHTKQINNRIVK